MPTMPENLSAPGIQSTTHIIGQDNVGLVLEFPSKTYKQFPRQGQVSAEPRIQNCLYGLILAIYTL